MVVGCRMSDVGCWLLSFGFRSSCCLVGPASAWCCVPAFALALSPRAKKGAKCGSAMEVIKCEAKSCKDLCHMNAWSAWGSCTQPCGGGLRYRNRDVKQYGTEDCPARQASKKCNTQPCPSPPCGKASAWTSWSRCTVTCGWGTRKRTRDVAKPTDLSANCGKAEEVVKCFANRPCNPVNCVVTAWGPFKKCDNPCGGGRQTRKRTIKTAPQLGGMPCPALVDSKDCNIDACPPPCEPLPWGRWSACSQTCGWGMRKRTRKLAKGSSGCPAKLKLDQTEMCADQGCCPTDCLSSKFSAWTQCSKTCEGGIQSRTRQRKTPATCGGDESKCEPLTMTQECNPARCPVDCRVSKWAAWTACTKSCSGGRKTRKRTITQQPAYRGATCVELAQDAGNHFITMANPPSHMFMLLYCSVYFEF